MAKFAPRGLFFLCPVLALITCSNVTMASAFRPVPNSEGRIPSDFLEEPVSLSSIIVSRRTMIHQQNWKLADYKKLCKTLIGKKIGQVQLELGKPTFSKSRPPVVLNSEPGCQRWMYVFGANQILIRLLFRKDVCIEADAADAFRDKLYGVWQNDTMSKLVKGKTSTQVTKLFGLPALDLSKGKDTFVDYRGGQRYMFYILNEDIATVLYFKNDKCFDVDRGQVAAFFPKPIRVWVH